MAGGLLLSLLGLTGCPEDDHSASVDLSGPSLSAALVQQAYLKASNTEASDSFGQAVALDGDTLVIGANTEDSAATGVGGAQGNGATNSGAVYVFTRSGGVWSQQAYLKASNTEANDLFGSSVAISGDTLVVGAYVEDSAATGIGGNQADNTASGSGAVYVFTRSGGIWSQQAYLKASNAETNDFFGYAVAVSGDTLAVGAYAEDSAATGVGGNQADNTAGASGLRMSSPAAEASGPSKPTSKPRIRRPTIILAGAWRSAVTPSRLEPIMRTAPPPELAALRATAQRTAAPCMSSPAAEASGPSRPM